MSTGISPGAVSGALTRIAREPFQRLHVQHADGDAQPGPEDRCRQSRAELHIALEPSGVNAVGKRFGDVKTECPVWRHRVLFLGRLHALVRSGGIGREILRCGRRGVGQ